MVDFCFKKQVVFWSFLLALFFCFAFFKAFRLTESSVRKYDAVVLAQPKKVRKDKLKQSNELSKQTRWGVEKNVVVCEGPLRRIVHIQAVRSELSLFVKKGNMQLQEVFYNTNGVMQKELFYVDHEGNEFSYNEAGKLFSHDKTKIIDLPDVETLTPMQRFRYFEAKKAVYDFDTDAFVAFDMQFWTYQTSGHFLIVDPKGMEPLAEGNARSMTMPEKFKDNGRDMLYAENLKITILNDRGIW